MTDNQDSKISDAVQPPTDRPLTAGDVLPMMALAMDKLMQAFPDDCIPSASVCVEVANAVNAAKEVLERPATPAASEGEGEYTSPCGYEAKLINGQWRVGMAGNLDCVHDAEITVHKHVSDEWSAALAKRIAAALASPPVSERERELEGALRRLVDNHGAYIEALPGASGVSDLELARSLLTAQPAGEGNTHD